MSFYTIIHGMRSQLLGCVVILLRPVARFCIRHGFKLHDLLAAAKVSFLQEGILELERSGSKITVSRLSMITGVHRQDVTKGLDSANSEIGAHSRIGGDQLLNQYSLDVVTRVLNLWGSDKRFVTSAGAPRVLSCDDHNSDFYSLVRAVSKDVNPASVLFELERNGHVARSKRGLSLERASFTPSKDPREGYLFVERDMHDVIASASENLLTPGETLNLHARTDFDGIRSDALPKIRAWFLTEGHRLHRAAREFLSQFDQDVTPDPDYDGPRAKVSIGTFSLTDRPTKAEKEKDV